MTHGQGHKANDVFAPKGAWQSGVNADFFALGYEPFGALLPGRNYSSDSYRFGFGGMPKDDEVHGATGTSYDFGARLYDPRVGRWLSLDPLAKDYASLSPYAFVANSPVYLKDLDGKAIFIFYDSGKRSPSGEVVYDMYRYGSDMKVPDDQFVRETIAALDLIRTAHDVQMDPGEPTPRQVVDDLAGDGMLVSIRFAPGQAPEHGVTPDTHMSRISYDNLLGFVDLNMDSEGGASRGGFMPPFVLLHHELRHAWHALGKGGAGYEAYKKRSDPHLSVLIDYDRTSVPNGRTFPNNEEYLTSMSDTPLMNYFGLGNRHSYKGEPAPVQSSTSLTPSSGLTNRDAVGSSKEVRGIDYSQSAFQ